VAATSSSPAERSIAVTRAFDAPLGLVWRAWTDPDVLGRWLCPQECTVVSLAGDLRVGGAYRETMRCGDDDLTVTGRYLEIVPERRLVFTHRWEEEGAPETVVTVELRARAGRTEVMLTQRGFASEASAEGHRAGWASALENLANHLAGMAAANTRG
jgi:uncharacterized protein YndB with AHSA1/START domain